MATRQEILDGLVDAEVIADFPVTGERRRRTRVVDPVTKKIGWKEEVIQVTIPDQGTDPAAYDAWIVKHRAIYAEREEARLSKARVLAQRAIEGELEAQLKAVDPALTVERVEKLAADRAMLNPAMISNAGNQALAKRDFAEQKKQEVGAMDKTSVAAFDVQALVWP